MSNVPLCLSLLNGIKLHLRSSYFAQVRKKHPEAHLEVPKPQIGKRTHMLTLQALRT